MSPKELVEALDQGTNLRRGPVSNLAFIEHEDGTATLFVNGETRLLSEDLAYAAPLITGRQVFPAESLAEHTDDEAFIDLLSNLVNEGILEFDLA